MNVVASKYLQLLQSLSTGAEDTPPSLSASEDKLRWLKPACLGGAESGDGSTKTPILSTKALLCAAKLRTAPRSYSSIFLSGEVQTLKLNQSTKCKLRLK